MINEKSLAVFVKTVMDFVGEWSNINEGFDTNNYMTVSQYKNRLSPFLDR
jgi:hypothetical protein